MISKELLSEVLENVEFVKEIGNNIYYGNYSSWAGKMDRKINIHELAHKCKEWAWDNGLSLQTRYCGKDMSTIQIVDAVKNDEFIISALDHADTEYEAIFKACEWILEQRVSS